MSSSSSSAAAGAGERATDAAPFRRPQGPTPEEMKAREAREAFAGNFTFGGFVNLCEHLQRIAREPGKGTSAHSKAMRRFKLIWTDSIRQQVKQKDASMFPYARLLMPHLDNQHRPRYELKAAKLAEIYAAVLVLSTEGSDFNKMRKFKDPEALRRKYTKASGNTASTDFADVLYDVLHPRLPDEDVKMKRGDKQWTLKDVNEWLDKLAARRGQQDRIALFSDIQSQLTALEQKWLVRIILKDMRLGVKQESILTAYHPDATEAYSVTMDLRQVFEDPKLQDPSRKAHFHVQITKPFQPMLADRFIFDNTTFKRMAGSDMWREFFVERKLDGERMVLHFQRVETVDKDTGKKTADFQMVFKSRNNIDYQPYINVMGEWLKKGLKKWCKEAIIDGEMLAWDRENHRFLPFGQNKSVALLNGQVTASFAPGGHRGDDGDGDLDTTHHHDHDVHGRSSSDDEGGKGGGGGRGGRGGKAAGKDDDSASSSSVHLCYMAFDIIWFKLQPETINTSLYPQKEFLLEYKNAGELVETPLKVRKEILKEVLEPQRFHFEVLESSFNSPRNAVLASLSSGAAMSVAAAAAGGAGSRAGVGRGGGGGGAGAAAPVQTMAEAYHRAVMGPLEEAVERGDEGIMVKAANSCYEFGERSAQWQKVKPENAEGGAKILDCLILGAYHGTRSTLLSGGDGPSSSSSSSSSSYTQASQGAAGASSSSSSFSGPSDKSKTIYSHFLLGVWERPIPSSDVDIFKDTGTGGTGSHGAPRRPEDPRDDDDDDDDDDDHDREDDGRRKQKPSAAAISSRRPIYNVRTVGKVGSGFTYSTLVEANGILREHWDKAYKPSDTARGLKLPSWFLGWKPNKVADMPDVIVDDPFNAAVIEIRASELVASDAFNAGVAPRFPRAHLFRWDKHAYQAESMKDIKRIWDAGGKLSLGAANKDGEDGGGAGAGAGTGMVRDAARVRRQNAKTAANKRARIDDGSGVEGGVGMAGSLIPAARWAETEVEVVIDLLKGEEVLVLPSWDNPGQRQAVQELIQRLGGKPTPTHTPETRFAVSKALIAEAYEANKRHELGPIKARRILSALDVVKPEYLQQCLELRYRVDLEPQHVLLATEATRAAMAKLVDPFGDPHFRKEDAPLEKLLEVLEKAESLQLQQKLVVADEEAGVGGATAPGFLPDYLPPLLNCDRRGGWRRILTGKSLDDADVTSAAAIAGPRNVARKPFDEDTAALFLTEEDLFSTSGPRLKDDDQGNQAASAFSSSSSSSSSSSAAALKAKTLKGKEKEEELAAAKGAKATEAPPKAKAKGKPKSKSKPKPQPKPKKKAKMFNVFSLADDDDDEDGDDDDDDEDEEEEEEDEEDSDDEESKAGGNNMMVLDDDEDRDAKHADHAALDSSSSSSSSSFPPRFCVAYFDRRKHVLFGPPPEQYVAIRTERLRKRLERRRDDSGSSAASAGDGSSKGSGGATGKAAAKGSKGSSSSSSSCSSSSSTASALAAGTARSPLDVLFDLEDEAESAPFHDARIAENWFRLFGGEVSDYLDLSTVNLVVVSPKDTARVRVLRKLASEWNFARDPDSKAAFAASLRGTLAGDNAEEVKAASAAAAKMTATAEKSKTRQPPLLGGRALDSDTNSTAASDEEQFDRGQGRGRGRRDSILSTEFRSTDDEAEAAEEQEDAKAAVVLPTVMPSSQKMKEIERQRGCGEFLFVVSTAWVEACREKRLVLPVDDFLL